MVTASNIRRGSVAACLLLALLLALVVAPTSASAHPEPLKPEQAAEGLGVEVLEGPDHLAEFLLAYQWAGTPTITDEDNLEGELAYVPGGCTPLSYAQADVRGKIALVDQAGASAANPCPPSTFFQKVQFAQRAGAVGFLHVPSVQARSNATAIQADIPALDLIRVTEVDEDGNEVAVEDDASALRDAVKNRSEDEPPIVVNFTDRRTVYETMSERACVDGFAEGTTFACDGIDLLGFISHREFDSAGISDLWGWSDSGADGEPGTGDTYEGGEYVIMGKTNGVAFFRITDPTNPEYLGELPNPGLTHETWHDIKVYADHAFIVSESEGHGMTVFDLTRLRDQGAVEEGATREWDMDASYELTTAAHNLEINEEIGMAYVLGGNGGIVAPDQCLSGLHMVDIRQPKNPTFRGCYVLEGGPGTAARVVGSPATEVSPAAYVHDAQCVVYDEGPDTEHHGKHICVTAAENKIVVADVTNPLVPRTIGWADYEHVAYAHQGWFDESETYWFVNDELAQMTFPDEAPLTRTIVMDLSDLDNPEWHLDFHPREEQGGMEAITHNNYVVGDLLYQSNYSSGLRVADISGVAENEMSEVAFFDTYPTDDDTNFDGTWSNYPFFESGTIAVSGRNEGLFLLKLADAGGERSVDVSCADCTVEIRSGESGTATMTVTNTGDLDDAYDVTVEGLPDGWDATADPDSVSVAAGDAADVALTIDVPRRARAGTYTFTVTATSTEDADVSDTAEVEVEVVKGKPSEPGPPDEGGPSGQDDGQVSPTAADDGTTVLAARSAAPASGGPMVAAAAMLMLAVGLLTRSTVRRRFTR